MDTHWFRYIYPKNLSLFQNEKLVAPEISLGGNFAYDRMGQFYHTTTVYGYIKRRDISISYETLMTILNSTICWWYLTSTGSILANGYFRYKPAYLKAFPIPHITKEIDLKIQDLIKSKEQNSIELKQLICSLYSLSEEDISIIYG